MKIHFERQTARDIEHHKGRIAWLEADCPKYSCGTTVNRSDVKSMLLQSKAIIKSPQSGYNTGGES